MAIAYFAVLGQKVGYEQIARNEIQKSSRYEQFEKLPAEQREKQIQITASITKYIGFAAPVTTLIVYLIVAGILMATFNFGAGAEVTFKQAMAISLYASLPMLLFYVLGMVSLIIGVDPEGFNIRNIAATNPAYFMDSTQNKFLYGIASGLDVFAIWSIILTGIGYASVSKLKRSTAIVDRGRVVRGVQSGGVGAVAAGIEHPTNLASWRVRSAPWQSPRPAPETRCADRAGHGPPRPAPRSADHCS